MLNYNDYYKRHGVRRIQQFLSPLPFVFSDLPRDSYYHYLSWDQNPDIDTSFTLFVNQAKRILVDFPTELTSTNGHPIRLKTTARLLSNDFFRAHKNFKYIPNAHLTNTDQNTLIVMNYNYLDHLYRYGPINIAPYHRWYNLERTRWATINKLCEESSRQHFVTIQLPKDLLAVSILKRFEDQVSLSMLKIFDTPEELMFMQIWKWLLVDGRENTVFGDLTPKNYMKVNLVILNQKKEAFLINLGFLNSWIKLTKQQEEALYGTRSAVERKEDLIKQLNAGKTQLIPQMMRNLWVRFAMVFKSNEQEELAVDVEPKAPGLPDDTAELDKNEDAMIQDERSDYRAEHEQENEDSTPDDMYSGVKKGGKKASPFDLAKLDDVNVGFNDTIDLKSKLTQFQQELEDLEAISKQRLKEKGIHIDDDGNVVDNLDVNTNVLTRAELTTLVYDRKSEKDELIKAIELAAEVGQITAAEYRKLVATANEYSAKPEPYGSKKRTDEFGKVALEEVQLDDDKIEMVIPANVIDKTMGRSTLNSFDPDYINKIIRRNHVAMVSSVQRAGILVKNHEVEIDNSITGKFEVHTLDLKPVEGASSTIRIRIPVINEDGTFVASGNKYVMRKQRRDHPIRKIGPTRVDLNSYYGKSVVERSTRKANSPVEWLVRKINLASMEDHPLINNVAPGNVLVNGIKAPYLYQGISANFRSFTVGKYKFDFSYKHRLELLAGGIEDESALAKYEKDGSVLCGKIGKDLVFMNQAEDILVLRDGQLVNVGTMFQLMQFDQRAAPVDYAEARIFSKSVPVGIILGYHMGFNNLLEFLGVEYRTVEGRKQKDLQADEYVIQFKDIAYIFKRGDVKSSLVLAGFHGYEKEIKRYEANLFNHRDIYFNLLESSGMSAMYIREMGLIDQMFVDPITENILKSMNEPTTYRGLLVRSCELLSEYAHPDSQDIDAQRLAGYERISGAIYKELVTSIRAQRNKSMVSKSKVEMSPYKVWGTIMQDQSIKITEDINPIQQLKEAEVITYVGEGGRAKEAMNRESRAFHINDRGIMSEATVDSTDVGINAYMSANPNLANMYGVVKKDKEFNPANLMSTSALLAPGAYRDD